MAMDNEPAYPEVAPVAPPPAAKAGGYWRKGKWHPDAAAEVVAEPVVDGPYLEPEALLVEEAPAAPEVHPLLVGEAWDAFKAWTRDEIEHMQLGKSRQQRETVLNP